jgi:dehydrogenase/reductase SDR family member 12
LIDAALEATVIGSYTRIGPAVRSRLYHWDRALPLHGRTVVITGATSGIGSAAATAMAGLGATLCLVGRDRDLLEAGCLRARQAGGDPTAELADLEDLAQVRDLAGRILERYPRVDVLFNNAGTLFRTRRVAPGGADATIALNLLSPYLLTEALLPSLETAGGRVITMTSAGMYTQRFDLLKLVMGQAGYNGVVAYARAKRAQVVLTEESQRRHGAHGADFFAVHPGWSDTPGLAKGLPGFTRAMRPLLRTPAEGADTAVWLASRPVGDVKGGGMWFDRKPRSPYRLPWTWASPQRRKSQGEALWEWCRQQAAQLLERR